MNLNQATAARLTLALHLLILKVNSRRFYEFNAFTKFKVNTLKKKHHCNWHVEIIFSTAVFKLLYIKDPLTATNSLSFKICKCIHTYCICCAPSTQRILYKRK